jgi:FkbM family methyltransferase
VRKGDLAFDIGANYGDRTRVLRSLGARVVAVEPLPACVTALDRVYGRDSEVTVVPRAAASREGTADLRVNQVAVLSSMSPEWIASTEASGRFDAVHPRWTETVRVETTTLDDLIADYGVPAFCKVDVEGFEAEVFAGLSRPIPAVAFEFAAEARVNLVRSVERLAALGLQRFAFSCAESFELAEFGWLAPDDLIRRLDSSDDPKLWGDVYARLP